MRSCDLSANNKNCDIILNCVLIMHMPLYNKLSIYNRSHTRNCCSESTVAVNFSGKGYHFLGLVTCFDKHHLTIALITQVSIKDF